MKSSISSLRLSKKFLLMLVFTIVLHAGSALRDQKESRNDNESPETFLQGQSKFSLQKRLAQQLSHVPDWSAPSHVPSLWAGHRLYNDRVGVTSSSGMPSTLKSLSLIDYTPHSTYNGSPSQKMLFNSLKRKTNRRRTDEKIDVSIKRAKNYDILHTIFDTVKSLNSGNGISEHFQHEKQTKENGIGSSAFQFKNWRYADQDLRMTNVFHYVNDTDQQELPSVACGATVKSKKFGIKNENNHFESSSTKYHNNGQKPEDRIYVSYLPRTFSDLRSASRLRRALFIQNDSFSSRCGQGKSSSNAFSPTGDGDEYVRGDFGTDIIKHKGVGKENKRKINIELRQLEMPEQHLGMKHKLDSRIARGLSGQHLNLLKSYFGSQDNGGMSKLYQLNKRYYDSIHLEDLAGLDENILNKLPTRVNPPDMYQHLHFRKRMCIFGIDCVLVLSKNHLNNQNVEYTGMTYLPVTLKNQLQKRNFDAIGGGILSGIKQNHLGKRYFNRISSRSGLSDTNQYDMSIPETGSMERSQENLEKREHPCDITISRNQPGGINNCLFKKLIRDLSYESAGDTNYNTWSSKDVDQISDPAAESIDHRYVNNNQIPFPANMRVEDIHPVVMGKRLDVISNGALGGIRQNFFDKKYFGSLSKDSLPGARSSFLLKRYFSSLARGLLENSQQYVMPKRNFDSTSGSILPNLNQNVQKQSNFPTIVFNPLNKLGHTLHEKRKVDPIFLNSMDQFSQNNIPGQTFQGKQIFYSISKNSKDHLNQNVLGRDNLNLVSNNRMSESLLNLLTKRQLLFSDKCSRNDPRNPQLLSWLRVGGNILRQLPHFESRKVSEDLDYDQNAENLYPQSGHGFLIRINQTDLSGALDDKRSIASKIFQVGHGTGIAAGSRSDSFEGDDDDDEEIYNDVPDKKSFDAISRLSSISGIGQNFIESSANKHRHIGSMARTVFPKRSLTNDKSLSNREDEMFVSSYGSLFRDVDNIISEQKELLDNERNPIIKVLPFGSDEASQDLFLRAVPEYTDDITFETGETDDASDYKFDDNVYISDKESEWRNKHNMDSQEDIVGTGWSQRMARERKEIHVDN